MSGSWSHVIVVTLALLVAFVTAGSAQDAQHTSVVWVEDGFAELNMAIVAQDPAALEALRARGVTLSSLAPDQTAMLFHRSVRQGNGGVIEALIEMGADIEAVDNRGYTPLMLALEAGNAEASYLLKVRGASLAAQAHDGTTAEYLASIVGLNGFDFPTSGSSLTLDQDEADTILLLAAELGDAETVRLALAAGANPAARAPNGWSAMMLAALGSYQDVLTQIIDALNAKEENGAQADARKSESELDMDPIQAAMIGRGGKATDHERVERAMQYLARSIYPDGPGEERFHRYIKAAHELGYNDDIVFAAFQRSRIYALPGLEDYSAPGWFLPRLEYALPLNVASDQQGWVSVQRILRDEGLYDGAIDGIPGKGTLMALMAYLDPVQNLLRARAHEAGMKAEEELATGANYRSGAYYGKMSRSEPDTDLLGELFRTRDDAIFPIGYVMGENDRLREYNYYDGNKGLICRVTEITRATLFCKLLDGEIELTIGNEIYFSGDGVMTDLSFRLPSE